MFLKAVVYSKVTKVKLVMYDSDPNNARIMMKYNSFHSMNPSYGRKSIVLNQSQYYHANAMLNFLSDANANNHISMNDFHMSFPNKL
jgi:hypothetical protein